MLYKGKLISAIVLSVLRMSLQLSQRRHSRVPIPNIFKPHFDPLCGLVLCLEFHSVLPLVDQISYFMLQDQRRALAGDE